jgi:hypothetical protein
MKKTTGGILYPEDADPRAYAEQLQAEVTSAETTFRKVDLATTNYVNFPSCTMVAVPANVNVSSDTMTNLFLGGSTIVQYGATPIIQLSAFNAIQFLADGWYHITVGVAFTESTTPAVNATRGVGFQHTRNSVFPGLVTTYAERTYTSNASPVIGTGSTVNQMIDAHAGDLVNVICNARATSGTVSGAGRVAINYIGPLVLTP